jgi:HK97 gp10 family phage protein
MNDDVMEVHGLAELEDELAKLGKKAGTKVLRSSLMFATTPMLKMAKARVPFDEDGGKGGHGRDALGRQTKTLKNGSIQLRLGERTGVSKMPDYRIHLPMVEFGTPQKAANPFLRTSFALTVRQVPDRFAKKFKQQLGH